MNEFEIATRLAELRRAAKAASQIAANPIEGRLEITSRNENYFYSRIETPEETLQDANIAPVLSGRKKTYIKKSDLSIAKKIASRDYAKEMMRCAEKKIAILEELEEYYKGKHAYTLHEKLHPGRKCIVKPILMSDREFAQNWLQERSTITNPFPIESEIYTEKHERVRSKTEKIIADKLYLMGVPYKYEEAIVLNGKTVFPDFTILNVWERKIYYWEHFGRIDYEDYRDSMVKKIDTYSRNHIVSGDNLIVTFETLGRSLSSTTIENIIRQNFLCHSL